MRVFPLFLLLCCIAVAKIYEVSIASSCLIGPCEIDEEYVTRAPNEFYAMCKAGASDFGLIKIEFVPNTAGYDIICSKLLSEPVNFKLGSDGYNIFCVVQNTELTFVHADSFYASVNVPVLSAGSPYVYYAIPDISYSNLANGESIVYVIGGDKSGIVKLANYEFTDQATFGNDGVPNYYFAQQYDTDVVNRRLYLVFISWPEYKASYGVVDLDAGEKKVNGENVSSSDIFTTQQFPNVGDSFVTSLLILPAKSAEPVRLVVSLVGLMYVYEIDANGVDLTFLMVLVSADYPFSIFLEDSILPYPQIYGLAMAEDSYMNAKRYEVKEYPLYMDEQKSAVGHTNVEGVQVFGRGEIYLHDDYPIIFGIMREKGDKTKYYFYGYSMMNCTFSTDSCEECTAIGSEYCLFCVSDGICSTILDGCDKNATVNRYTNAKECPRIKSTDPEVLADLTTVNITLAGYFYGNVLSDTYCRVWDDIGLNYDVDTVFANKTTAVCELTGLGIPKFSIGVFNGENDVQIADYVNVSVSACDGISCGECTAVAGCTWNLQSIVCESRDSAYRKERDRGFLGEPIRYYKVQGN